MNKFNLYFILFLMCLFIINCGRKTNVNPDSQLNEMSYSEMISLIPDSTKIIEKNEFYELENSVEDIMKEIEALQSHVMQYKYSKSEPDYSEQLKEYIDQKPPSHQISLKNGSIIEGTIKKDQQFSLLVQTDLGKITINKSDILEIHDLILPIPDIVFIGHGNEEILPNYRKFTGKIMNQGDRRADFVRVIYNLWDENTELISSDSSFIGGPQIVYRSGIVTDTVLEPKRSIKFSVDVMIPDSINVAYVTRDVRWEIYD